MEYYQEDLGGSIYSRKDPLHLSPDHKIEVCDWTDSERIRSHEEFYRDYVRPLHLTHCLGIGFSDAESFLWTEHGTFLIPMMKSAWSALFTLCSRII